MIKKIQTFLKQKHLGALLITRTDSFLGEYYPPEVRQLQKVTRFTGSAGIAIVTPKKNVLFVDSRYTEQAKIQSKFQVFEVPTETTPSLWIEQNLKEKKIGYNPAQHSAEWVNYMISKGVKLQPISEEDWTHLFPLDKLPDIKPFNYESKYAGESTSSKIEKVAQILTQNNLDAYLFTVPDSVSYLLNQRCLMVPEYPVIFKRLIVFKDGGYELISQDFSSLKGKKVGLDISLTPMSIFEQVQKIAFVIQMPDPAEEMKSIKNQFEQKNIEAACLFESTVICKFLAWIEKNKEKIDELECDKKLKSLRSKSPFYRGDSFATIAASGEHAARAHYQADKDSNVPVSSAPLLLVDTGGNYLNGTTDMTRTIAIKDPTPIMIRRYTQVLKGHIACATTIVHQNDLPQEMDKRAHQFLRADGVDFGHSTGHGIGMYLAVHEYPPTIYENTKSPLKPGMLFSNEPAYYDATEGYGIRLENMILTKKGSDNRLDLKTLLLIPFDYRLIDEKMLTADEKLWLKNYHQEIKTQIFPALSLTERKTLEPLLDFFLSF